MSTPPYIEARFKSFTIEEIATLAQSAEDKWGTKLKSVKDLILQNILAVFSDQAKFAEYMESVQLPAYRQYINPAHPKAAKAIAKLRLKWRDPKTYDKFVQKIQNAFAEGGDFDLGIDHVTSNNIFEERIKPVLMVTGGVPLGLGPAPKLMMLIEGYDVSPFVKADIGESYTDTGITRPLVDPALPPYWSQGVIPTIVEGVVWHQHYTSIGDQTEADNALSALQSRLSAMLTKLLRTGLTLDAVTVAYDSNTGRYEFYIKITETG